MEPVIPTSFIPKRPIDPTAPIAETKQKHSYGLLSLLIFIVILGTAASYGLAYVYSASLMRQKTSLETSLKSAQEGVDVNFVADMKRLDDRIHGVRTLLGNHIVVTPIFEALEATTLHSIQYDSFSYQYETDPGSLDKTVHVTLEGVTKNYTTLALQSDAFLGSNIIKNPVFSELTVDDKDHTVNFKLSFDVDPNALSYESFIAAKNAAAPVLTPQ